MQENIVTPSDTPTAQSAKAGKHSHPSVPSCAGSPSPRLPCPALPMSYPSPPPVGQTRDTAINNNLKGIPHHPSPSAESSHSPSSVLLDPLPPEREREPTVGGVGPWHQTRSITPHLLELTVLHRLSLHHLTLQCGHLAAVLVQLQGTGEEGWGGQRGGGGVGVG